MVRLAGLGVPGSSLGSLGGPRRARTGSIMVPRNRRILAGARVLEGVQKGRLEGVQEGSKRGSRNRRILAGAGVPERGPERAPEGSPGEVQKGVPKSTDSSRRGGPGGGPENVILLATKIRILPRNGPRKLKPLAKKIRILPRNGSFAPAWTALDHAARRRTGIRGTRSFRGGVFWDTQNPDSSRGGQKNWPNL